MESGRIARIGSARCFSHQKYGQNINNIGLSQSYMSQSNRNKPLQHYFRSQIVQEYPPVDNPFLDSLMIDENNEQPREYRDFFQEIMQEQDAIVEKYEKYPEKPNNNRVRMSYDNMMQEQSDHKQIPSRNSSLSSRENKLDFIQRSFQKFQNFPIKKYSGDGMMDIQENDGMENQLPKMFLPREHFDPKVIYQSREKEKKQKIQKLQQVGCKCRKSKCLKMYCQCFHLQIFCNENCNCVDCGNMEPNSDHHQAVIDALTRNPKAFHQQQPKVEKGFNLGVGLGQVRKGCKCKKTKCLKKYCECFNSGEKCGKFCKCQNCQNLQNTD